MEALRKLEEVQRVISLMEPDDVTASKHYDSDRFLANLVILLMQPCGELNMEEKCRLVYHHIPKISATFLEESPILLGGDDANQPDNEHIDFPMAVADNERNFMENTSPNNLASETDFDCLQTDFEDMAMIGLHAMQMANSTLEDFCRSYFMFHGLDVTKPHSVFLYLPLLSFTESYIYQLDNFNEKLMDNSDDVTILEKGSVAEEKMSCRVQRTRAFKINPFGPLVLLLERCGLLTERIREEFKCGEEYWLLERKLCSAVMANNEISIDDVRKAVHFKSFDYRVLNLLLYQLRKEKVNDMHMEFLSASEFLVEVADDLFDYEDDVLKNNFNILRMFVRFYGPSTAPTMLAKYITGAEEKYDILLKTLDPKLAVNYNRRCEEATREGGKISGPALGTWNIPAVIANEEWYRSNYSNSDFRKSCP